MFLKDLLLVFLCAGVVVFLFQRLRIPTVVGLLVTGVLVGPYGLRVVDDVHRVDLLAEIGVVVLLFTVGLEFSLSRVVKMAPIMLQVGLPQVGFSLVAGMLACMGAGIAWNSALFGGMLIAMSSTAIVIKLLSDRGEVGTPHGRISVAVLLLQDLLVVAFVLMVPLLTAESGQHGSFLVEVSQGMAMVLAIIVVGRYAVPSILYQIVQTRNRELFLISIFVICIGTAALTNTVDLSLPLGAFLAGLVIAESEYGHQTLAEVMPFRDTLSSLFFISVGMLLDINYLLTHGLSVTLLLAAILLVKSLTATIPSLLAGYSLRTAILAGVSLAQIGEFSFVLAKSGLEVSLITQGEYQLFLAVSVLSMAATPLILAGLPKAIDFIEQIPFIQRWQTRHQQEEELLDELHDHVVIAGYGFNGRNLATVLKELKIPYVVLEMNPQTVRRERALGQSIYFGDSGREAVLEHVKIEKAKALVVAINDPISSRRTVQLARHMNPDLHIVVRTRYFTEAFDLKRLGADSIISEEFETSLEIFAHVLREYHIPGNMINRLVANIRADHYQAFRGQSLGRTLLSFTADGNLDAQFESCQLAPHSHAIGKTLGQLRLRNLTGVTIVAVKRQGQVFTNPAADLKLELGDVLVLLGQPEQFETAIELLELPAVGMEGDVG